MPHFSNDLLNLAPVDRQLALLANGGGLYFAADENLRLAVQAGTAGLTVSLVGTFWSVRKGYGTFEFTLSPAGDRTPTTGNFPMGEGVLINASVQVSGAAVQHGDVFIRLFKTRGRETVLTLLHPLLAGYPSLRSSLNYPPVFLEPQGAGRGAIKSITGTDPAAGVEISETVPTNALWRLASIRTDLTTDGTAANRLTSVFVTDGTNTLWRTPPSAAVAASGQQIVSWVDGFVEDTGLALATTGGLPRGPLLREGYTIETLTTALQAGDNYAAPQLQVEEWIVD